MRLGILSQSCDNETGIGRIVRSLSREFVKRGNEVHVIAQTFRVKEEGWHAHTMPSFNQVNSLNRLAVRFSSPSVLKRLKCDVVNSFVIGRGCSVVTAQSCHRAGMDILRQSQKNNIWRRNLGIFDHLTVQDEKYLFGSSETKRIIAVSKLVKEQIVNYHNTDPDRIVVVPNGVNIEQFRRLRATVDRRSLRIKYNVSENECLLLFVGNEFDRKGLQTIIQSLSQLRRKDVRLLVVGSDHARPYIELARKLKVEDRLTFVGRSENPETFFAIADIFVFPTLYEPYGLVILEAMAAGLPVITSSMAGAVEGLVNNEHGLYMDDPSSTEELAAMLERLIDDPSLRGKIGDAGQVAVQQLSWDAIAVRTLAVYEEARSL